jgi:hypothetical protein
MLNFIFSFYMQSQIYNNFQIFFNIKTKKVFNH